MKISRLYWRSIQRLPAFGKSPAYMTGDAGAQRASFAEEQARVEKIVSDSEAHPSDSLAKAMAISDKANRAQALLEIAQHVWKKHESVAKEALRGVVDVWTDTNDENGGMLAVTGLARATTLYIDMGDNDSAKKIVEAGMALADKLYKIDTNADDPNTALSRPSIYQTVTERILASLKAGVIPWEKPWKTPHYTGGPFPQALPWHQCPFALVERLQFDAVQQARYRFAGID